MSINFYAYVEINDIHVNQYLELAFEMYTHFDRMSPNLKCFVYGYQSTHSLMVL